MSAEIIPFTSRRQMAERALETLEAEHAEGLATPQGVRAVFDLIVVGKEPDLDMTLRLARISRDVPIQPRPIQPGGEEVVRLALAAAMQQKGD